MVLKTKEESKIRLGKRFDQDDHGKSQERESWQGTTSLGGFAFRSIEWARSHFRPFSAKKKKQSMGKVSYKIIWMWMLICLLACLKG